MKGIPIKPSRKIIAWGSYDESKPRVRLLLHALRSRQAIQAEINIPVWAAIRDKAVAGPGTILKALLRLLAAYPGALLRLMRQPARSAVLLPYPAIADIFLAWPIARLRRHRIIFDAFISLHDTIVQDRRMVRPGSLAAKFLWAFEWAALHLADLILVDTDAHAEFFAKEFGIPPKRIQTILVGAEPAFWAARTAASAASPHPIFENGRPVVLFYGQLIPLHGLDTILEAIGLTADEPIHWLLIGSGQEEPRLRSFLARHKGKNVTWIPWVNYEQLPDFISAASVGLGVFGTSDKAGRVIPNKVFQILAAGKPVITRAGPAVDPIAARYPDRVTTTAAGDGRALAEAVRRKLQDLGAGAPVPSEAEAGLGPGSGVQSLLMQLESVSAS